MVVTGEYLRCFYYLIRGYSVSGMYVLTVCSYKDVWNPYCAPNYLAHELFAVIRETDL
jgi:hypothetical protein